MSEHLEEKKCVPEAKRDAQVVEENLLLEEREELVGVLGLEEIKDK